VTESRDWQHGVFMGATVASEKTAAAAGKVGELRRDPFAMLPFCGYNMGDYFAHWLEIGKATDAEKLPKIYYVNWFRKNDSGKIVWPGFGENSRVLKWIVERLDGLADAVETPIGSVPTRDALDTEGLGLPDDELDFLLTVDRDTWREEAALLPEHFETFGEHLPKELWAEHEDLVRRLNS
jgi:phosphoenolpyruvate carboxykinase (GTP)